MAGKRRLLLLAFLRIMCYTVKACRVGISVLLQLPKLARRVRLPYPAPRQKKSAPFRFLGLRKSRESSTSAVSFFLSKTEVLTGNLRFGIYTGGILCVKIRHVTRTQLHSVFAASFFLSKTEVLTGEPPFWYARVASIV